MTRDCALNILKNMRPLLEARGVVHAALFGSVARDKGGKSSDVDVVLTLAACRRYDLIDLGAVQTLLDEGFGCSVDLVIEPIRKPELRRAIEQDRVEAF